MIDLTSYQTRMFSRIKIEAKFGICCLSKPKTINQRSKTKNLSTRNSKLHNQSF